MLSVQDLNITKVFEDGAKGVFSFDPLPGGFGHTLGNTLRRVLYTSLEGAGLTQVKIDGAVHQFGTVEGVKEDVVELCLNLKQVRIKKHTKTPVIGSISKKGPGIVTAGDIDFPSDAEVVNKALVIATLADKNAKFEAEVVAETGVGFSPVEERETSKIGTILLDTVYSPVSNVNYSVEPARFGKKVDLDKLTLTVETDGTVTPWEAVSSSAKILTTFFEAIANGGKVEPEKAADTEKTATIDDKNVPIDDLSLSNRAINALKKHGLVNLNDLAKMTDAQIADIKNLGEKTLEEVMLFLKKEGHR
ncbi:TPA: DNA-directed RNA polymerase subunit alpha [candidate division WWE3 bacterium]|uniref:DNA-directed RNA polymerase subunit alpha n=2 Tax=Katanobacteria TaxID=422282 RepID=A0A0G1HGU5_UNCKA|nr:MAG: DNA-directed RNA polymerase subunit alpha [candidate division WWE3 bacterium GW2011_GWA2_44_16]HAZ29291.1 DNA-directed RNA polymerase subunit alpha [candidate division WWE3 bacterium]